MRAIVILTALVLSAGIARAKTICTIGDSLFLASTTRLASGVSPWRAARVVQMLADAAPESDPWAGALVIDLSVPGTGPSDWLGPIDPTRCSPNSTYWPMARLACAAGNGMVDHIPPLTCNVFLLLGDASEVVIVGVEVEQTVDDIEELVGRLEALATSDGVILTEPPLFATLAGTAVSDSIFGAVRTEMLSRGIVNGPGWSSPRLTVGWDGLHIRDVSHIQMGVKLWEALPR